MCIGIPMRVISSTPFEAVCERHGVQHSVSVMLIGEQEAGAWLLTHLGSAIRVLDAEEARMIDDALTGLSQAAEGGEFDALFADLIDREPQLPPHLRDN
ncbi:HypC/HybG/HupF family hydrogenase formation chaperone [Rhizobium sp. L1K21]|uniref:HypC/HybG/HupF family hydrogenase formation chaperone n=1 Tax=Rhizobium sp. L1K21 TaxID=2954933 RepID=UPI002093123B|nr:HypC/HybG/HupF family hydrogenase formation chaperone [Rhizobium sp. L1K21]MCO6184610.1 HypC/HybG/HupF family hydrogenase formation chaperone [Rhizobium sp. L1K21]